MASAQQQEVVEEEGTQSAGGAAALSAAAAIAAPLAEQEAVALAGAVVTAPVVVVQGEPTWRWRGETRKRSSRVVVVAVVRLFGCVPVVEQAPMFKRRRGEGANGEVPSCKKIKKHLAVSTVDPLL